MPVLNSIVVGISAFFEDDPASIPGRGVFLSEAQTVQVFNGGEPKEACWPATLTGSILSVEAVQMRLGVYRHAPEARQSPSRQYEVETVTI